MNCLNGHITCIESNDHVSLVDVAVGDDTFTALLLETAQTAPYLVVGNPVRVLFKETEVSLARNLSGQISLRNRVHGTITGIRSGAILSEVVLDYGGQPLTSIITTRSVKRLGLQEGDTVEALVKANEVSLTNVQD